MSLAARPCIRYFQFYSLPNVIPRSNRRFEAFFWFCRRSYSNTDEASIAILCEGVWLFAVCYMLLPC